LQSSGEITEPCEVPVSDTILEYAGPQPFLDQAEDPSVPDPMLEKLDHPFVRERSITVTDVGIQHPIHLLPYDPYPERIQRIMRVAPRSETTGEPQEVLFVNLIEDRSHRMLDDFVLQACYAQGSLTHSYLSPYFLRFSNRVFRLIPRISAERLIW
jgi:hypothetical protein